MQVPVRMMAFCSSTAQWFVLDATVANGRMTMRGAHRVPPAEVESSKAMWKGPDLGQVSIDASAFVCPCCGGANRVAQFLWCPGCEVFLCGGMSNDRRIKGACSPCSWTPEQLGPPRETLAARVAVRM